MSRTANRFDFDPRALEDRKAKTIKDLDLMGLQRASDGNAAILKFFPHNYCAIYQEAPALSDAAVVWEETLVSKEESKALKAVSCHSFFQIFVTVEHCLIFTKIVKTKSAISYHCNHYK